MFVYQRCTFPVSLLSLLPAFLAAQTNSMPVATGSAIHRALRATVTLEVVTPTGRALGTGFLATRDGSVATAEHVIHGATGITAVFTDGRRIPVTAIAFADSALDLAIIRLPKGIYDTIPCGNSDALELGQRLIAIGTPFGLAATITDGILSARREQDKRNLLQVSIPVSPGNSGGPVITEDGRVIGIVISGLRTPEAENLNFALPVAYLVDHLTGRVAAGMEDEDLKSLSPAPDVGEEKWVDTVVYVTQEPDSVLVGRSGAHIAIIGRSILVTTSGQNPVYVHTTWKGEEVWAGGGQGQFTVPIPDSLWAAAEPGRIRAPLRIRYFGLP